MDILRERPLELRNDEQRLTVRAHSWLRSGCRFADRLEPQRLQDIPEVKLYL